MVPAHNEQRLLPRMLGRVPAWVDGVVVVDDASGDGTYASAEAHGEPRVHLIRHEQNQGVGAAIRTGYRCALGSGADLVVVMAADDQMDPDDLPRLLEPLISGVADYAKGNRLLHASAARMPIGRRVAAHVLGRATAIATGYKISDSQCGYTAITAGALRRLELSELWPRYGYPNDLLGLAARAKLRVTEVPVTAVYADEQSGIRPWHFFSVAWLIGRRWARERARTQSKTGNPSDRCSAAPQPDAAPSQRAALDPTRDVAS